MSRRLLRSQRLVFAVAGSLITSGLLAPAAKAQGSEPVVKEGEAPAKKPKGKDGAERMQVTGSRIKRTEVEGVSTVIQVDQAAIEKSGVSTVGEVLQNMAVSIDGSYTSGSVSDPRGNVTNVNLRGLGAENTLVLVDGRRLPDEGGLGVVDLSSIPIAAIERIEVLKDSASAIYGSDATGGVVNIITKKDFEGSAFYVRGSTPTGKGGDQTMFSYVNGIAGAKYRVLTALSYRKAEAVYQRDRDWTKDGLSSYSIPANAGLTYFKRDPATGLVDTNSRETRFFASPNCPTGNPRLGAAELCSYNYAASMGLSPETTEVGILNNFDYEINSKVSLYTTVRAQRNENIWNMAPNAGNFDIPAATLAANPSLNLSGNQLVPETGAVIRYRSSLWGNRVWEETNNVLGGTIGLKGEIANSGWEWNVSAGRSQSRKKAVNPSGFFLKSDVENAISLGNFDVFEPNLSNPALVAFADSTSYEPFTINETRMNTYDANVTGELFPLPGGNAAIAVGISRFDQFYSKEIDELSEQGEVYGVVEDKSGSGDRQVNAVYAELAMPVLDNLEVQLAARHDQYSDFGSTTNPKLGVKYLPIPDLLVRGNVGTGFKAPTLYQINNQGFIELANLYDRPNIANNPERQDEVEIETYGNPDLKEETSLNYNFGLVTEPFENLSLSADYWYVEIQDIVRPVNPQKALDAAAEGTPLPDITITRVNDDPQGPLKRIRVPTANLGRSEDAGYDLGVAYWFGENGQRIDLTSDYSRKIYSRSVAFPGDEQRNVLGETGKPAWRAVNAVTYSVGGHGFLVRNNLIGPHQKTPTPDASGTLSTFSTYDVQYAWNHPWNGSVAVGALNVLNAEFPRDDTERVGEDQRIKELYSADGRMVYVNLNQTF